MAKQCKNCHQCRGMCMNTWEPLEADPVPTWFKVLLTLTALAVIAAIAYV